MKKYVVAKVFLQNHNNQILLLRRSATAPRRALEWDLPGGFVEDGEDPLEAAIRELAEEAGVNVGSAREVLVTKDIYEGELVFRHYIIAMKDHPEITLSYEHDSYVWVASEEYFDYMKYQPHVEAFKRIFLEILEP